MGYAFPLRAVLVLLHEQEHRRMFASAEGLEKNIFGFSFPVEFYA